MTSHSHFLIVAQFALSISFGTARMLKKDILGGDVSVKNGKPI